jgi:pSer/pThr/pTyr-binding forkhead associated (FHA) protein
MKSEPPEQDEPPSPDPSPDGAPAQSVDETLKLLDDLSPDEAIHLLGTAFFGEHARLILYLKEAAPLIIEPPAKTFLGRFEETPSEGLYINFVPYGAKAKGVSRLHAVLHRTSKTLAIEDLNSRNKTYVNGRLIAPHQVQILHDGDEIFLAGLHLRIAFQYG